MVRLDAETVDFSILTFFLTNFQNVILPPAG